MVPEHGHQDAQRADGLEAVGMGRQAAHGVEGHRVAGDRVVLVVPAVGPGDRQFDLLIARGDAHLVGQPADGLGGDAGDARRPLRGILLHPLLQELERRLDRGAVLQGVAAHQARIGARGVGHDRAVDIAIPPELVLGSKQPSSTCISAR